MLMSVHGLVCLRNRYCCFLHFSYFAVRISDNYFGFVVVVDSDLGKEKKKDRRKNCLGVVHTDMALGLEERRKAVRLIRLSGSGATACGSSSLS